MKLSFLLILALLFGIATPAARAGSAFAISDPVSVDTRSTVSTLAGLALSGGTLSPSFDPGTTGYTATMTSATTTSLLLFDSGVAYFQTDGGYTLSGGVRTGVGFHNSDAWNIDKIVIVADFTFDYVAGSAELRMVSPLSLKTERSFSNLPIAIGPVIGTRAGTYESREVTIDLSSVIVASGDHFLGLGFNGIGTFAGWAGYNGYINATDLGAIYTENDGASWIGPFSQSHAIFSIYGTPLPRAWTLFTAAEGGLALPDAGRVTLSPLDQFSQVTGAASHGGANALKFSTVDSGATYAERAVIGPAVVSFWWRVSSEKDYDFFKYSIDGVPQQAITGEGTWLFQSFTVAAGSHQIRWTYTKDDEASNFEDAGYLDDLVVVEAYQDLQVTVAGAAVTGSGTLDFGTVQQLAAEVTRSVTLKNNGTIPMNLTATLPTNSGFVFSNGLLTKLVTLNAGQQSALDLKMLTATGGQKSVLLGITAIGSRSTPPAITLSGFIDPIAPKIACSWSGGALTSGQSTGVDLGIAPSELTFTVTNTGEAVMSLSSVSVSPADNFQVVAQPGSSVARNGNTTFTVRALDANRGNHLATLTVVSDASNEPNFTIPLASRSLLAVAGTGVTVGSLVNIGTLAGWDLASTLLADGSTGQAIKTGAVPNSGSSTLGATFEGPGLLTWNWKVSSQKDYDWLLCEVNGVEVAGISTKTAAWQSQVVQIPAGSQVRWTYRKDAANSSGTDSGHLTDIRFDKFTVPPSSFQTWSEAHGNLPPMQALAVGGGLQAMYAWLGGVDPATGPAAGSYQPILNSGVYQYRYRVNKGAAGMTQPQVSTDMVTWDSRRMKQTLLSEDSTSAVIELSLAASGKTFSRLAAVVPAHTPPAPLALAYVAGGTLPSSSGLSGQSVSTFYIAKTETTWGQWQSVRTYAAANGYDIGSAGAGSGADYPVTNVSWYQVVKWCNARSEMEGLTPVYQVNGSVYKTGASAPTVDATANGYRLPTESQWEFAARGGVNTQNYEYSGSNDIDAVAWYSNNSVSTTHPVETKQANELGVSDMSGNVWEWCESWYPGAEGSYRVVRGGSWYDLADGCRVALRYLIGPSYSGSNFGFRVARSSVP